MTPVCLTMIVKDEAAVIARAIAAARPFVDAFAIVDTGSTDDTRTVSMHALDGLPGEYVCAPWEGYGLSRTRSLDVAARVLPDGYALIVDADDVLSGSRPDLAGGDAYAIWVTKPGAKWTTTRYLRLHRGITYVGPVHEMPVSSSETPLAAEILDCMTVASPQDGATSQDPQKYMVHARMISSALADDPTNTRNAFYLAQSYRDHGDDARAAPLYLARAAMGPGSYPEEVYCSFLEAGRALWRLGRIGEAKRSLLNAHASYPGRREAMAELARLFAVQAATAETVGTLFVETGGALED